MENDFELEDLGDGRFALRGEVSFETANRILRSSEPMFGKLAAIQVDLSKVSGADSAALALMLEWKAQARRRDARVDYVDIPESLQAIARTTGVDDWF